MYSLLIALRVEKRVVITVREHLGETRTYNKSLSAESRLRYLKTYFAVRLSSSFTGPLDPHVVRAWNLVFGRPGSEVSRVFACV